MLLPLGLLSQGGGAGAAAFELISTQVLGSAVSSVTFSSIAATYTHLQLRMAVRTSDAADTAGIGYRFNGDSATNYTYHLLTGDGANVSAISATSQAQGPIGIVPANTSTASAFGATIMDVLDYTNTNKNKTVRSFTGKHSTAPYIRLASSLWLSTAAVTSITLIDTVGGNFVTGSRFSLYGIRGA